MHIYKWDESLKTDHANVDNDNHTIVKTAQTLSNLILRNDDHNKIIEAAKSLENVIFAHFELEEMMQLYSNFNNYNEHKRQHARLLKEFTRLINRIVSDPESKAHASELDRLIEQTYFDHIRKHDTEAAKYILQRDYYHN
ncbi:MAG TPA: hypothetical protein DCS67_06585 [Clostridiales bacterium UBA8960]|jgi:hemerythrin|nr:hypothetical protein [Clostridiales bacterium UBA8960]